MAESSTITKVSRGTQTPKFRVNYDMYKFLEMAKSFYIGVDSITRLNIRDIDPYELSQNQMTPEDEQWEEEIEPPTKKKCTISKEEYHIE